MKATQQGFTLVEMMLVGALLGVLVVGVMQFFTTLKKNTSVNTQVVEIQQNSRLLGDLFDMQRDWDLKPIKETNENILTKNNDVLDYLFHILSNVGLRFFPKTPSGFD